MKKLIPCLFVLFTSATYAQSFEGTITWSMKMEFTDPAMKAKMEEGMKKMNDPANQAKMKEMEAKMNDPQMKKMLEANPGMKAQMENAMKMAGGGSGGSDMSSMMPKGFTIKVKDSNFITKMEGGPMPMEMLYLKDKDQTYRLDRQNASYSIMPKGAPNQGQNPNHPVPVPKVTKTTETMKILNYTCTKYLVETTEGAHTIKQTIWATTEIKDIDLSSLSKQRMGRGQALMHEGIEGIPLRIESTTEGGSMVMEVTDISRGGLTASEFTIPSDYKETKGGFGY